MKPGKQIWLLTFLLIALGAFPLRAAVITNNLSFALTCVRQGNSMSTQTTQSETVQTLRLSNKQVLGVLAVATTSTFPSPAALQMVAADNSTNPPLVFVTGKGGVIVADVSRFFTFVFGDKVTQSKSNPATKASTSTSYYLLRVVFDDGQGNSFDVSGTASEKYHVSGMNRGGAQKEAGVISCDTGGVGASGGNFTVYQGKIKLSGSDTL
jgi:hypothetical protein